MTTRTITALLALAACIPTEGLCDSRSLVVMEYSGTGWDIVALRVEDGSVLQRCPAPDNVIRISAGASNNDFFCSTSAGLVHRMNLTDCSVATLDLGGRLTEDAAYLPARQELAFSVRRGSADTADIVTHPIGSRVFHSVTSTEILEHHPVPVPGGNLIYLRRGPVYESHEIWLHDFGSGTSRPLASGPFFHFSPTVCGSGLFFISNRGGTYAIRKKPLGDAASAGTEIPTGIPPVEVLCDPKGGGVWYTGTGGKNSDLRYIGSDGGERILRTSAWQLRSLALPAGVRP